MEGEAVPHFISSVHQSTMQFGFTLAMMFIKVWNELLEDIHSAISILSFRKKLKAYLFTKAYPPLVHRIFLTITVVTLDFEFSD